MRILLAHPGTQHSRHLARELETHGLLDSFWTGIGFSSESIRGRLAQAAGHLPGLRGINSRILTGVPQRKIRTFPALEIQTLLRLRRRESLAVIHDRNAAFQRAIQDKALHGADAVIGFDTSSWILAQRLKAMGRPLYLDRTIAHPAAYERIMGEVARRYPDWGAVVEPRWPAQKQSEEIEHDLARRIVVGSPFVEHTLREAGVPAEKIRCNPYGVNWSRYAETAAPAAGSRPLRFLFAGSIIARKGVPALLDAWRALGSHHAELWLAGRVGAGVRPLIPALPGLRILGQISQQDMPGLYAQCDVFVLPTFFEGLSLVVLEALASGLPVITTPNSGAENIITHPSLGHLVTAGNTDELIAALKHFLTAPPRRSETAAAARALQDQFSWEAYGARWVEILRETA